MKRIRLVPLIAAFALVLASCASANVAATVNGSEISDDQVFALATAESDSPVVGAENFRNLLLNSIFTQAMVTGAEQDFGVAGLDTQEAIDAFVPTATQQEAQILQSVIANPDLSANAVNLVAVQLLTRRTVKEQIANDQEFLEGVWQDNQNLLIQACARHVLVASEEEAEVVKARLEAGEDFAALASELSLDTQSPGGALACPSNPSVFVQPFSSIVATAPVGELIGPVQTEFGWHVIQVESRETPATLDELAEDPVRWIPEELLDAAWSNWLNDTVAAADIDVRSQIGTWYSAIDGILPPPDSP
ncbi:MAG: peptidylprolyl isomerase [Acidimicrobiia bacterium]|nr:MAG: peptidylprolyl isomerase [Acidimicrobiia bacterium]